MRALKLFEDFLAKFRKMIEAGKLDITVRHGQIRPRPRYDILFDTGKTEIKPEGKTGARGGGRRPQRRQRPPLPGVGHTDIVPIKTKEFASNWELSAARALAVIKLLLEKGVASRYALRRGLRRVRPRTEQQLGQRARQEPAHRDRDRAEHRGPREDAGARR